MKHLRATAVTAALALLSTGAFAADKLEFGPEQCGDGEAVFNLTMAPKAVVRTASEVKKYRAFEEIRAERAATHQWLASTQPAMGAAKGLEIAVNKADRIAIGAEACDNCWQLQADDRRFQVGVAKTVETPVTFAGVDLTRVPKAGALHSGGVLSRGADGELVWTLKVRSPEATGLRIGIDEFKMPEGTELYVFTDHGQAFGPYVEWGPNDNGVFWTDATVGDTVYLQLRHYGATDTKTLASLDFDIIDVGHLGPRFDKLASRMVPEVAGDKGFCSFNASCVENVNCTSSSVVNGARSAIGQMLYRSGGGYYICTGGLLADADSSGAIPYFLTANHCVSKGREANSLLTYYDFDTPCNGNCYDFQNAGLPSVNGASIKATGRDGDYTLLQLASFPSGSRTFLGWTTSPVANANGTGLYRVSHPGGAPQAYSEHSVDANSFTCSGYPRGSFIYSTDTVGATEGGSSGSPVLNGSGEVVGQLFGACGSNLNDTCDAQSNRTMDGAFASYYPAVESFLGGGGGGGGGGGQCDLLPSGASCTSNSECCSNSCKGKRGARTCR